MDIFMAGFAMTALLERCQINLDEIVGLQFFVVSEDVFEMLTVFDSGQIFWVRSS